MKIYKIVYKGKTLERLATKEVAQNIAEMYRRGEVWSCKKPINVELYKMRKFRLVQFLTGIHAIHHLQYSYGYKLPFVKIGWFKNYGWKNFSNDNYKTKDGNYLKVYHNCTLTGTY